MDEIITTTPTGGVVDFLCVLKKLTEGCAKIPVPPTVASPAGTASDDATERAWMEQELAEATSTALWRTVSMYQPALHGRSPGTLLSMNLALVQLQRHMRRIMPLLVVDEGNQHHHLTPAHHTLHTAATSERHQSASSALDAFNGRVLNYKKSLLHVKINVEQLLEWVASCPSFQTTVAAQRTAAMTDPWGSEPCSVPGTSTADQTTFARRSSAFDLAVCAFAIANRMRLLHDLLESLERSMLSRSVPKQLEGDAAARAAHVQDPYRQGLESISAAVSEWTLQAQAPLMRLYVDVSMRLLCASDVPDAMAWMLAAERLHQPPRPISQATVCGRLVDDAGRRVFRKLLGMVRSCQSVEMLVAMTQWLSTAQINEAVEGGAASIHVDDDDDDAEDEPSNIVNVAAEWCVQLAAEHCIALMVTSQLMLQECDAREFSRWRREDDNRRAGADACTGVATPLAAATVDCPMCGTMHAPSFMCEVARRNARHTICESVVTALTGQLGHIPSHQLSLIAVAVHRVRFLSDGLEQSPIFERLYETERQLLEQQLEGLQTRQRSSFRLDGNRASSQEEHLDEPPVSSPSSSSMFGRHGGATSATAALSSPQFLSPRAERELDGLYLLRPPVFTKDDVDVLHLLAVSTGDDASRMAAPTEGTCGVDPNVDVPMLLRVVLHSVGRTLRGRRLVVDVRDADNVRSTTPDTVGDEATSQSSAVAAQQHEQVLSFHRLKALMVHASALSHTLLAAIEDPSAILAEVPSSDGVPPPTTAVPGAPHAASSVVQLWSEKRATVAQGGPLNDDVLDEPIAFLAELQRAVQTAQKLLNAPSLGARRGSLLHRSPAVVHQRATDSKQNHSGQQDDRVTAALALKQLVLAYHSAHHGRAPSTLLAVSTACATAARLFRDARRDGAKASPTTSRADIDQSSVVLGYTEDLQRLALLETSMWNRAIGHQRSILALSHLEPVSRCALYIERGTLYFSQSMWVASAHEYAVAERILMSRRAVVTSGLCRLRTIRLAEADALAFAQTYARVLPTARAGTPQQQPEPHALNHLLLRLRYNVAVCLWCAGHVDAVEEWLECALADSKGEPHPVSSSPSVHALCTSVMHLCKLLRCSLSSDAADGIFFFLGRMSSVVSSHPTVIAGALVLVQHVVEHHVSRRVCNGMTASIKAALHQPSRAGIASNVSSSPPPAMTLEAQGHLVAAACNHLVVELSSGKIRDIHVVLRDGLPTVASSWDKLLVHAIVTCMNFCSAFPDSCWYEAAYQQHMQSVRSFQQQEAAAAAAANTTVGKRDAPASTAVDDDDGVLNKLSKTFSSISNIFSTSVFGGSAPRSPQIMPRRQQQQQSCGPPLSPQPSGASRPPHHLVDPYDSVRKFFERDVELLKLLEWVLTTPLIAIREDDVRVVSVLLDEGFLEIQSLVELRGGSEERRQFAMELQSQTNHVDPVSPCSNHSMGSAIGVGGQLIAYDTDGGNALNVVPKPFAYMTSPFAVLHETTPSPSKTMPTADTAVVVGRDAGPNRSSGSNRSSSRASSEFIDVAHNGTHGSEEHHVFESVDLQPYIPSVVLDKLVGQTAFAIADARRGSAMGSVYSPIMPGRSHVPPTSFGSRGSGSPHILSSAPETILTDVQRAALHHELPMHYQLQPWRSVYSTCHHGTSYRTLLANCDGETPLILCLRIEAEQASPSPHTGATIVGALIPNGLRLGHQRFFGGVDTFVFRFQPPSRVASATTSTAQQHGDDDACGVYRWTHDNEYFVNCRPDYLAIGGGGKGAAIYLDESLCSGSTSQCATFASPPLIPQEPTTTDGGATRKAGNGDGGNGDQAIRFDVTAVEVYAIGGRKRT